MNTLQAQLNGAATPQQQQQANRFQPQQQQQYNASGGYGGKSNKNNNKNANASFNNQVGVNTLVSSLITRMYSRSVLSFISRCNHAQFCLSPLALPLL
jgi:hypothetical protein